ncbi:hypothetical protein HALLA_13065 [Halostagnicola larsenii XH-48]|uniref:Uncharacterized protein n=1 Tax=Halostagnicola larsenii XH-48 TaxID=797299 RepID=W0JUR7_9EURY|nr:hypothetical protein HALLA_13065 [Halostagnicola larsenii XH-48]
MIDIRWGDRLPFPVSLTDRTRSALPQPSRREVQSSGDLVEA